jgi:6-phosphogluconolactonase
LIRVYDNSAELSRAAAGLFAEKALEAVRAHGRFAVLLAGGSTPLQMYRLLAEKPYSATVPWQHVHIFWGDERAVPFDDARNNSAAARKAFIDSLPIPEHQLHPIKTDLTPFEAASDYEQQLKCFFAADRPVFDLVLLGLGDDGHTASLFPGRAGYPENQWVVVTGKDGEDISRISLSPQIINQAAIVAFLVSGAGKSRVLKDVLHSAYQPERLPAQLIRVPENALYWLVDRDAYQGVAEYLAGNTDSQDRSTADDQTA